MLVTTLDLNQFMKSNQKGRKSIRTPKQLLKSSSQSSLEAFAPTNADLFPLMETSEEDSLSFHQFHLENSIRNKTKVQVVPEFQARQQVHMGLVTSLEIRMASKVSIRQIYEQLKVYYFQRNPSQLQRKYSLQSAKSKESESYYSMMSLLELFNHFEKERDDKNKIYILCYQESILLHSCEGEKFALMTCYGKSTVKELCDQGIPHYSFETEVNNIFSVLVRKQSIKLFFNWCINRLVNYGTRFELISNYKFMGGQERYPIITYSNEDKLTQSHLKHCLKLQGYLFKEHLNLIKSMGGGKDVRIQASCYELTSGFQSLARRAFREQDEQRVEQQGQNVPSYPQLLIDHSQNDTMKSWNSAFKGRR